MKNSTKKNPDPGDELLTTEEAAKRLERSAKTLEYIGEWRAWGRPSTGSSAAFATCSASS